MDSSTQLCKAHYQIHQGMTWRRNCGSMIRLVQALGVSPPQASYCTCECQFSVCMQTLQPSRHLLCLCIISTILLDNHLGFLLPCSDLVTDNLNPSCSSIGLWVSLVGVLLTGRSRMGDHKWEGSSPEGLVSLGLPNNARGSCNVLPKETDTVGPGSLSPVWVTMIIRILPNSLLCLI